MNAVNLTREEGKRLDKWLENVTAYVYETGGKIVLDTPEEYETFPGTRELMERIDAELNAAEM